MSALIAAAGGPARFITGGIVCAAPLFAGLVFGVGL